MHLRPQNMDVNLSGDDYTFSEQKSPKSNIDMPDQMLTENTYDAPIHDTVDDG